VHFQTPVLAGLRRLSKAKVLQCSETQVNQACNVYSSPRHRDPVGCTENVTACLNTLTHHPFNLNQSGIYTPVVRSPGSFFSDNNNYCSCIYPAFFVCRSQDASSKQAAIITAHHYQQRKWGAGEVNTLLVTESASGEGMVGTRSPVVPIRRAIAIARDHGWAGDWPKPDGEETVGKFWLYTFALTFIFVWNLKIVWVGRDPYRLSGPTPCNEQGHPQLHQCSEPHPVWRWVSAGMGHHHLSGQHLPAPRFPYCKKFLSYIQSKSPLFQFETISLCPVTTNPAKESAPFLLIASPDRHWKAAFCSSKRNAEQLPPPTPSKSHFNHFSKEYFNCS